MPYGIRIAARQSENQFTRFCGDPNPYPFPQSNIYWPDFAEETLVADNGFEEIGIGISVEDDEAIIVDNDFSTTTNDVLIGTEFRFTYDAHPVTNTVLLGNHWTPGLGNRAVNIVHGSADIFHDGATCPVGFANPEIATGINVCNPSQARATAREPQKHTELVDASCQSEGTNFGCVRQLVCPEGFRPGRLRMTCNLETPFIKPLPAWGRLRVATPSNGEDARCAVNGLSIQSGEVDFDFESLIGLSNETPADGTTAGFRLRCQDHDENGGDCSLRARLQCVRQGD